MPDPQLEPVTADPVHDPSRRGVLRAAGLSGVAVALLAACGRGGDGSASPPPAAGSSGGDTSPAGSAGGIALVATAEVPVGGGVILEAEQVVVTQPADGEFKAFSAVCPHQSCLVTGVKDDTISCACHGSAYSAEDGSVLQGPSTRGLTAIPVTVEGDQVVEG